MILLQVESFGVFERASEYGVLGLVSLAFGALTWLFIKRLIKRADDVEERFNKYITEERQQFISVMEKVTDVMEENNQLFKELNLRMKLQNEREDSSTS